MATTRKVKGKEPHQPEEAAVVPKGEKSILKVKETAEEAKKMLESLTREYQDVLDESAGLFGDISITHTRLLEILRSGDDLAKREVTKLYNEVNKLLNAAKELENKARAEKQRLEEAKALAAASPEPPKPPKAEPLAAGEPPKAGDPEPIEAGTAKTREQKETKSENIKLLENYLHSSVKYDEKLKVLKAVFDSGKAMKTLLDKHEGLIDVGDDSTIKEKNEKNLDSESVFFLKRVLENSEREDFTEEEDNAFLYAKKACEILSGGEVSKPDSDLKPKDFRGALINKEEERRTRAENLQPPAGVPDSLVHIIKRQLKTLSEKGSVADIDPDAMTGVAREAARRAVKVEPPKAVEPATAFAEGVVEVELNEGKEIEDVLTEDQKLIIDDVLNEVIRKFLGRDKNDILQIKITNKIGETSRVDFNEITERRIMRDGRIVRPLKAAGITSSQLWNYFPEWLEKNGLGRSRADATAGWENAGDILAADPDEIKTLTDKQKSNIAEVLRYPFRRHLKLDSKNQLIDSRNNVFAFLSLKDEIDKKDTRPFRLQEGLSKEDVLGYLDEWLEGEKARLIRNATATSAAEPAKTEIARSYEISPDEIEKTKALFTPDVAVKVKGVDRWSRTDRYGEVGSIGNPKEMLEKSELVAVGDAHGSAWKILESAILAGMATMPEANAKEFQRIYKEMVKMAEEMDKKLLRHEDVGNEKNRFAALFDKIKPEIATIKWIGGNRHMVYLGDTISDRGLCDGITLAIFKKFRETGGEKNISILASNHDFDAEVGGIFPFQKLSLLRTPGYGTPEFGFEVKDYLASQDLFIYDAQTKTFFSHAPLTLRLIEVFKDVIEFTKEIDNEQTLVEFVKFANDWYKKVIKSEDTDEIKLRNLLLSGEIDGLDYNNLLWSRTSYDGASQVPFSGIIKNYVHGHDDSSKSSELSTDEATTGYKYDDSKVNIFNLDNTYRKAGGDASGEIKQTHGFNYSEFFALEKSGLVSSMATEAVPAPVKIEPAPIDPLAPPVPKATTKPPEKSPEKPKDADENFVMRIADLSNLDHVNPDAKAPLAKLFHEIFDGKTDEQVKLIKETNKRLSYGFSLDLRIGRDFGIDVSNEQIAENLEKLGISLRRATYYSSLDKKKRDAIDETAGVMEEELRKWAQDNGYYGNDFDDNIIVGSMFWDTLKYEANAHGGSENRIKNPDAKKIAVTSVNELLTVPAITTRFEAVDFIDVKAIDALSDDDLQYILDNCYFDASPVGSTVPVWNPAYIGAMRDARLRQRLGVQRMKVWCQENVKPEGRRTTVEINYSSGDKYIGEVDAEDKPHGKGVGYYKNGNVYDGQYEHGKRSGIGRLINKGILMYDGDWDNDVYHGSGWLHYNILVGAEKKDRYLVGDFENGKPKGLMKIFARSGDPTPMATKDFTGDEFDFLFELAALETSTPVTTETADELPEVDKDETPEEEDSNKLFFADEILEIIGAEKLKDVLRKFTTDTPDQVKQALKDLFSAPLNPVMKARLKEKKIFGEFDSEVEVKFLLWWKGNRGPDTENGAEVFYNAFQYQLVSEIERQAAANPDLQAVEKGKFWSKGSIIRLARAILPGAGAGLAVTTTIGTGGLSLFAAAFAGVIISRVFRSGNVQLEREEKGGQKKKVEGGWLTRLGRTISNKFSTAGERREEVDLVRLRTVTSAIDEFKGKFLNRADNPEAAAEMMAAHLAATITEEEIKYPVLDSGAKIAHVEALKIIAERAETRKTQAGEYQATIEAKGKLAEYLVAAMDFNNDKMRRNEVVAEAERKIAGQNNGLAVVWDEMKKGNLLNLGFGSGKVLSKEWLIGTVVEGAVVTTTVAAGAAGTALTAGKAWWAGLLARAGFRAGVAATFGAFEGASGFGTKEKEEYARELLVETRQKLEEAKNDMKKIIDDDFLTKDDEDKTEKRFIPNLAGLIAINRVADEELQELKLFETAEGRRLYTEMQEFLAIVGRDINYPDNFTQKVDEAADELVSSRQNQYKIAGKTGKKIKTALTSGAKRAAMVGAISAGIEGGRLVMGGGGSGFARIQEGEAKVFATSQKGDVGFFDKGEKIAGFTPNESSVAPAGSGGHAPKIPDEGSTPEPVPIQAAEPTPEPISTEPKVLATHVAGTGHDKGSLIGSMQAMQEKLTAENLAAIRAHHPQWAKLGDAKLIDRWRIEMARQHGQTFDREGQYFKTVFKKGDVVSLVQEADGYPKIELNKTHTLARPHFVPRDGVQPVVEAAPPEAEAPKPTAAMKLTEAVNAGRTEVAGVELPAGSKVTHADFNPDFPNLVDLSITDASGNVQHHLYRAGEGAGGGAESAPALKRVNAFEVGLAKAPVGTESAIKTATSSFAARPVGVSGGGVHQGTDVLGKEKLVGAPVVETAMRSKAVGLADHLKTTDARAKYLFMSPKFKNEAADIIKEFASQYVKDHPGVDLNKSDDLKNFEELWKTESLKYFTNVKTNGGVVGGGAESQGAVPEESTVAEIAPKGKGVAVEPAVEAEKVKPTSAKVVKTAPETAAPKEPAVEAVLASKDKPIVVGGKLADGRHLVSVYNAGKATADKLFLPEKTKPSLEDGLLRMNVNNVSRAGELRLAKVGGAEKWVWDIDAGDQTDRYVLDKLDNNGYGEAIALPKED